MQTTSRPLSSLAVLAHTVTTDSQSLLKSAAQELNLADFIKQAGLHTLERLVSICHQVPKVAAAINDFHGLEVISQAIKAAGARKRAAESNSVLNDAKPKPTLSIGSVLELPPELQDPIKSGELKIVTYDFTEQTKLPHGYTEEDAEKLQNDLVLITDKRDPQKTTIPYDVKTEKAFVNPTDTGIYEVLTKAGKFERCLVLVRPQGPRVRETFLTVIRLTEPRNWRNISSRSLWVVNQETTLHDSTKWDKWWDHLSDGSISVGKRRYVIVGPRGDCTLPFRVRKDLATQFGSDVYEVDFDTHCPGPHDFPMQGPDYGPRGYHDMDWGDCCDTRIHIDGKDGGSLRNNRGDIYVPKGFKIVPIEPDESDKINDKNSDKPFEPHAADAGSSENPPLLPGNITDVELNIIAKTASFSLWSDGTEVEVNAGPRMTPLNGLITLVRDHGFREDMARTLLKRAAKERKVTCRVIYPAYLLKDAADPYLAGQGPSSPAFPPTQYGGNSIMGSSVQTQMPQEDNINVPGMSPELGNREMYDPTQNLSGPERNTLEQAVGTGQKEMCHQL